MTEIRFSLVGPGRVGQSLAAWLVASGARLAQVAARDPDRAREAADALGGRAASLDDIDSSGEHLLLVTVAEGALPAVAERLAHRPQAPIALHVAGASDASVLAPLERTGGSVGTLHPLRAFPEVSSDPEDAHGVVFTLDGARPAVELAERLVSMLGGIAVEIDPGTRTLYHLAATLAAGGVVTLLSVADELADRLGLPDQVVPGYLALARQAIDAAGRTNHPGDALTGPVARGDIEVVTRQIAALESTAPELLEVVSSLARETLRQRQRLDGASASDSAMVRILARRKGGFS